MDSREGLQINHRKELIFFSFSEIINKQKKTKKEKKRRDERSLGALPFEELTSQWRKQKKEELGYFLVSNDSIASSLAADPKAKRRTMTNFTHFLCCNKINFISIFSSQNNQESTNVQDAKMGGEREREVVESIAYGA
jgi:hypothetical protein